MIALAVRLFSIFSMHPVCAWDDEVWRHPPAPQVYKPDLDPDSRCLQVAGDALYMYLQGKLLADGHGYIDPTIYLFPGKEAPGALKLPAYPTLIAGLDKLGLASPDGVRVTSALLGVAGVMLLAHLAWTLAGRRAGMVAGVLAALNPMLWINDWRMMSESLALFLLSLLFVAAYRFWEHPRPVNAALLGLTIGLAGLNRSESYLLMPVLLVALLMALRRIPISARLKLAAIVVIVSVGIAVPWIAYNLARFQEPSYLSSASGGAMLNGTCDGVWFGDDLGRMDLSCGAIKAVRRGYELSSGELPDESVQDRAQFEVAREYIDLNRARLPVVMAARVGRFWELYAPADNTSFNAHFESRGTFDSWAGLVFYYFLAPLSVLGGVVLWRRRVPISPFLSLAAALTVTVAIAIPMTRYRVGFDGAMCVLGAIGLDSLLRSLRERGRGRRWIDVVTVGDPALAAPEVQRAAALSARHPRRSLSRPARAVAGAGVIGVLITIMWSAGIEPAPGSAAYGGNGAQSPVFVSDRAQLACKVMKERKLDDLKRYFTFDQATVSKLNDDLDAIAPYAPTEYAADVDAIRAFFREVQASGGSTSAFDSISVEKRTAVSLSFSRLVDFGLHACKPH